MLTICPTPIGNLDDITLRVIKVLEVADLVACEDTRTTIKLLNHLNIKKKMFSYHEHNELSATTLLIERLKNGDHIALVSDAGMPGISDPGEVLIKACIEQGLPYTVLPGASAVITALVASQLPTMPFFFEGFLDRNKRKQRLQALEKLESTIVFYESPHRVVKTLQDLLEIFGNRKITLAREISKRFETYWHTCVGDALSDFNSGVTSPKGEYVLVVEGYTKVEQVVSSEDVDLLLKERILNGDRVKDVAKELSKQFGFDRQELYKRALAIQVDSFK